MVVVAGLRLARDRRAGQGLRFPLPRRALVAVVRGDDDAAIRSVGEEVEGAETPSPVYATFGRRGGSASSLKSPQLSRSAIAHSVSTSFRETMSAAPRAICVPSSRLQMKR